MASAPFPERVPAFFIDLLTKQGDVVLDPFSGSGTTAKVALAKGRRFIVIDKEAANIRLICNRLRDKRNPKKTKSA
jgi:site-specific DNA-methyltransferase (adenine-specific)/site-specific DNA-methyltransferase (cytosine-N4-specific)